MVRKSSRRGKSKDEDEPEAEEEEEQQEQQENKEKEEEETENKDKEETASPPAEAPAAAPVVDAIVVAETQEPLDPKVIEEQEIIKNSEPETPLELALTDSLKRKEAHIERLSGEVQKLKAFISKRKQTYKRKRKDEGAPTRALSAYNIYVQDRFSQLAKENEQALRSADTDAQLKRVPPASLVASTGNQWKELPAEKKSIYEERYVPCMKLWRCRSLSRGNRILVNSLIVRLEFYNIPGLARIARDTRNRWRSISRLTSKPIVNATRLATTCFSLHMFSGSNSRTQECLPREGRLRDWWEVRGRYVKNCFLLPIFDELLRESLTHTSRLCYSCSNLLLKRSSIMREKLISRTV